MEIDPFSFGFIIDPFSLIDVSAGLDQPSLSVGHIFNPITLIECPILPNLFSSAISFPILPLSVVDNPIFQLCWLFPLIGEGLCEVELSQPEIGVFDCLGT